MEYTGKKGRVWVEYADGGDAARGRQVTVHELGITENLLALATRHGVAAGAKRVTDLYLVIGDLSSVVDESVQFYWDLVSRGTVCEGARLHFERVPAELTCDECGERYRIAEGIAPCPGCGGTRVRVTAGGEFRLESLGLESGGP